jgi:hypothetical protein
MQNCCGISLQPTWHAICGNWVSSAAPAWRSGSARGGEDREMCMTSLGGIEYGGYNPYSITQSLFNEIHTSGSGHLSAGITRTIMPGVLRRSARAEHHSNFAPE